jgi:hypothetical protein
MFAMTREARCLLLLTLCSLLPLPSCGGSGPICTYGNAREESQPCCPDLGMDACGAGLVCAALDRRQQHTCYREYSRRDLTECSEDRLCASSTCNPDSGLCQSAYGATCTPETGCAPDPRGFAVQCGEVRTGHLVCHRVGLAYEDPCSYNVECSSNDCSCSRGERTCCNP